MADPVVLLVAPAGGPGAALRERLIALGFRCELIDSSGPPRGWRAADGDVILAVEAGGYSSPVSVLVAKRAGTPLEGLPLLVLGSRPSGTAEDREVDEVVPAEAQDRVLQERLRAWGRWGRQARRLRAQPREQGGQQQVTLEVVRRDGDFGVHARGVELATGHERPQAVE